MITGAWRCGRGTRRDLSGVVILVGAAMILLYLAWSLDGGGGLTITDPLFNA